MSGETLKGGKATRSGRKTSAKKAGRKPSGEKGSPEVPAIVMRQVGMEVLREDLEPGAWARALVEGAGTRDSTLSQYARIRVEELMEKEGHQKDRKLDLEVRRAGSFRHFDSEPIVPHGNVTRNRTVSCVDAVFWHMVAMVAGVGTLVAASIMWPELRLNISWHLAVMAVVGMQLIPVMGWWPGRNDQSSVSYAQASQMAACLMMLGSATVGCGLLMGHPPRQPAVMAAQPVREQPVAEARESADPEMTMVPVITETVASSVGE